MRGWNFVQELLTAISLAALTVLLLPWAIIAVGEYFDWVGSFFN